MKKASKKLQKPKKLQKLNKRKKTSIFIQFFKFFVALVIVAVCAAYIVVTQPLLLSYHFPQTALFSQLPQSQADTLQRHVKYLSEQDRTSQENQQHIVNYILSELNRSGIEQSQIERQTYLVDGLPYQNIIVHFKAAEAQAEVDIKTYLIGAHYDAYSASERLPGADDNASGVSGLLEIARMLQQIQQIKLDRNIDLVFYATEEPPFFRSEAMGSYQHAKTAKHIEVAIVLEMIGYFSEQKSSQRFPIDAMKYLYPSTGNFIAVVSDMHNTRRTREVKKRFKTKLAEKEVIGVESINAPARMAGIDFSDHRNYWQFDIPAVMITDTSFYRNAHYHTRNDTYEKLDYRKMKAVVDATLATVLSL